MGLPSGLVFDNPGGIVLVAIQKTGLTNLEHLQLRVPSFITVVRAYTPGSGRSGTKREQKRKHLRFHAGHKGNESDEFHAQAGVGQATLTG